MAKQTLGQGDSNVVVRNQVVYGALPQDVIDRMGDTTLALQTTEQNVLPAINELKSNLTANAFAIATGTFENTSGFTFIQYPTGYSVDNCTALSLEVYYYSGWRSGMGIATNSFSRLFVALNVNNIGVYNSDSNLNGSDFRVILKKIPS